MYDYEYQDVKIKVNLVLVESYYKVNAEGKKELNRLQTECEKFDKSSDDYKARMWELFDELVEMGEDPNELFDEM